MGRVLNVVVVPGQRELVVRVDRIARPAGVEVTAIVGHDHAVVFHGLGDDARLGAEVGDVDACLQAKPRPHRRLHGHIGIARIGHVRGRIEELVEDDLVLECDPDRVVDDALPSLTDR